MTYITKTKIFALLFSSLILFAFNANAQWNIPEDAKNTKLPSEPTHDLVKTGKEVYTNKCIACHGVPGEGKNLTAINATELGEADYQKNHNAGEVYFQINEGKGGMPSFKDQLSEEDKWCVIFYVKSFDEGFEISGKKTESKKGNIVLQKDESAYKIFANVTIPDKSGNPVEMKGVDVNFFVKRYFGKLKIGDAVSANQVGTAVLNLPSDIPGDENGLIEIIAEFKDKDAYGEAISTTSVNLGTHLQYENITDKRTMWGANDRVPLWILFSYIIVTLGVWLVIGYVVMQLIKLRKVGK